MYINTTAIFSMYSAEYPDAIAMWDKYNKPMSSVLAIEWSHHCAGIFFVLDSASMIHIWNLLQNTEVSTST